jgi:hypothetical protein
MKASKLGCVLYEVRVKKLKNIIEHKATIAATCNAISDTKTCYAKNRITIPKHGSKFTLMTFLLLELRA